MRGETWTAVVPVKPFSIGKSRLGPATVHRERLARAFFLDTLDAVLSALSVSRVIVVTSDADAAADAANRNAAVVHDSPGGGLNHAIVRGVTSARRTLASSAVAVVTADLPCLRAADLDRVLRAAQNHSRAFVPDHTDRGTTVLTAGRGHRLRPAFEGSSRQRHLDSGAVELRLQHAPSARLDVDTIEDLGAAAVFGVGTHTAELLTVHLRRRDDSVVGWS
ncbi:2-phospho-L-lactate guanylyltransferase [Streptomyces sp. NBC_01275]|uniref:2-phospho-L-lactate guanylyltransferase n=1 Tax=Streptomyces sp. NBC_01275 TaxID=2903807 RepID=UPI002258B94A|nr:2-phospho-L-lactate guanylyltransferase [Streptomyces sp. NBC_01275]MCX4767937.1 2-phospho-L-lactate guanylyltransferase [Streptomyces sp. NBC_01275]